MYAFPHSVVRRLFHSATVHFIRIYIIGETKQDSAWPVDVHRRFIVCQGPFPEPERMTNDIKERFHVLDIERSKG